MKEEKQDVTQPLEHGHEERSMEPKPYAVFDKSI